MIYAMPKTKTAKTRSKKNPSFVPTQIAPGFNVHARITDLDWQPPSNGCVGAEAHSWQAGEVYIEAGPTADGRFYAAAYGYLGIIFWEQGSFETLEEAQLQVTA